MQHAAIQQQHWYASAIMYQRYDSANSNSIRKMMFDLAFMVDAGSPCPHLSTYNIDDCTVRAVHLRVAGTNIVEL